MFNCSAFTFSGQCSRRSRLRYLTAATVLSLLAGCAGMMRDAPNVNVVGLEPLPGQGLELRFNLKLRVQNPSDKTIEYDGIAVELDVDNRSFASGVSNRAGSVPRFGETVLSVPISVSAFSALKQALSVARGGRLDDLPYVMRGKLAGPTFGTTRFSDRGTLDIPGF